MTKDEESKDIKKKEEGVPTLISPLHPISLQIGEHVLAAMEHEETVAVLTTITGSRSGPQVVSIPLGPDHLLKVHEFLKEIHQSEDPQNIPCVGFHCYIDQKEEEKT